MEERTRLQNVILAILTAMILLFGVLIGVSRTHKGVEFEGTLLKQTAMADRTIYTGKAYGDPVTITVIKESETRTTVEYVIGDWLHDVCVVEYPLEPIRTERGDMVDGIRVSKNGTLLFAGGYDPGETFGWYDRDGEWAPMISVRFVSSGGDDFWSGFEYHPADILTFAAGPELTARGSWGVYLQLLLLTLLLMLDVAFPTALFYLRHCCDVKDPEPSDFYIAIQKVGWYIYPFLLCIGYIAALREFP